MQLIVDNLTCIRGNRKIFEGLSFTIASGEGLLLEGPNGAGKTSLLRTLAGFIRPGQGSVILKDGNPEHTLAEQCHYVGHLNGIKHSFTVQENVAFWAAFLEGDGVKKALERFMLSDLSDVPASLLSAGQKRRLGLTRLILAERPLWLLDEPSVSLDRESLAVLAEVITAHIAHGGLVVAATHVDLGIDFTKKITLDSTMGSLGRAQL